MRVGILVSNEQFEEFSGASRLEEAVRALGHEAVRVYERSISIPPRDELKRFDVIIVRPNFTEEPSHHQAIYDGLRASGIRLVNGQVLRTKNKLLQRLDLLDVGIPMPKGAIVQDTWTATSCARELGFPVMIKVPFGTRGKGVFFAPSEEVMKPITDYLSVRDQNPFIVEEFIAEANHSDIRAFVIGNEVIASMQLDAPAGDVRSNAGGTGQSVELTAEERELAIKATRVMNLDIAGVDILRSNCGPLIMEVNANPGFKTLEQTTGIDVAKAIVEYAVRHFESSNKI
ncbi:MAG: RimK family alpha-L-glutamate ligase [Patescibacteria group bacterium]|jgi:ribosomal protein S6--L-glutamate ligase